MNYKLEKVGLLRKYKPIYGYDEKITIGSSVKLIFKLLGNDSSAANAERLWVDVTRISDDGKHLEGTIDNDPLHVDLKYGDAITFQARNVYDIDNS